MGQTISNNRSGNGYTQSKFSAVLVPQHFTRLWSVLSVNIVFIHCFFFYFASIAVLIAAFCCLDWSSCVGIPIRPRYTLVAFCTSAISFYSYVCYCLHPTDVKKSQRLWLNHRKCPRSHCRQSQVKNGTNKNKLRCFEEAADYPSVPVWLWLSLCVLYLLPDRFFVKYIIFASCFYTICYVY